MSDELLHLTATALRNLSAAVLLRRNVDTALDDAERVLGMVVEQEGDIRPPAPDSGLLRWTEQERRP